MRRLHKFLSLVPTDQRLLIRAAFLLGVIRLGLWLLPFRVLRRTLARVMQAPTGSCNADQLPSDRIAWAVAVASRYVPKTTCLAEALVAQVLLIREGYPARLCIGVSKDGEGRLQAHAWVESRGEIVVGGEGPPGYTRLLTLESL